VAGQIANPLVGEAGRLARHEARTLHLSLRPEQLGQVEVKITRDAEGRLSAQLAAEHETARQALAEGIGHLRAALERAGLVIDRLEVSLGSNPSLNSGGQASEHHRPQSAQRTVPDFSSSVATITDGAPDAQEERLLSLRA
jgi:flagellar hook-length control protein FliK